MKKSVFLIIVMGLLLLTACSGDNMSTSIGDDAYDFEVVDHQGETVKLSDFEGKPVFMLTWTST